MTDPIPRDPEDEPPEEPLTDLECYDFETAANEAFLRRERDRGRA